MITEHAMERAEFTCGHCWHRWTIDYDVQLSKDDHGRDRESFTHNGIPTPSPYTPVGAWPCPQCGRRSVGRLVERRPLPHPSIQPAAAVPAPSD
ncbi:hypothetical protein NGB36_08470 [Streptomyces sp. RB6PN25]|uniref:Uncharacterized protein n=1 Tax=Streptomyces humicola TaxID=2953240 RepID=A0ABT1PU27_9ACTN|nr:hypothetical protein [Streptomyces humicola]MCQ4080633.1 hypothetical protein [Streptomyces humicola]